MNRQYTHDSVQRALDLHRQAGRIRSWRLTDNGKGEIRSHMVSERPKYVIDLYDYGVWQGSLPATHGLVVGLRVGFLHTMHRVEKDSEEAVVNEMS